MKKITFLISTIFIFTFQAKSIAQTKPSEYKIVDKIHLPGEMGWDYLVADADANRLFVSHGNMVQVIDTKTNKMIGSINDLKGVHGIALAKDLNKGYITNGRDSSVTIFDYTTLKVIINIKVTGRNPDAILYDDFTKHIYTFNGGSSNATVIDANTDKVINTITLEGKPEFPVTDGKGKIYVNIENKSTISGINATTMKIEKTWSIAPAEEPSGLAFDIQNQRLFSVCDNKMMAISDAANGKLITTVAIGEGPDGVAFDAETKRIYAANGDGTMTIVQEESADKYKVIETMETQKRARTITIDTKTHHLYLPTAEFGEKAAPTPENPKPRPAIKADSFVVLDIAPVK